MDTHATIMSESYQPPEVMALLIPPNNEMILMEQTVTAVMKIVILKKAMNALELIRKIEVLSEEMVRRLLEKKTEKMEEF